MNRRDFLKTTGGVAILGVTAVRNVVGAAQAVSIIVDPKDPIASAPAVAWAVGELQSVLRGRDVVAKTYPHVGAAPAGDRRIIVAGSASPTAQQFLNAAKVTMPASREALCLIPGNLNGRSALLAGGSDARGLVYAVLELADRAKYAEPGSAPLDVRSAVVEKPASLIRSCARYFESDVEDKSWFADRRWWGDYLTALASHRFNRVNLSTGLGYNGNRNIPDAYFYFAYPFLLAVPGYHVRAVPLSDAERDNNLATLRFISGETVARGLQFNLGLWSHAYQWPNPDANYTITGLTPETHAAYCRDALAALLKACPNITGLSFRTHSESGIPAGSYAFWETVFQAIKTAGRRIDLDLHAKGTDQRLIDIGLSTGNPVSMVPKFWAEHNGMPYHQASIRELERVPRPGRDGGGGIEAERRFLRYGYGDYLRDDRNFGIIHRIWPGTQRHLLWGDPTFAAAYGRVFSFSGSLGFEFMEPLSFKGRMGSGRPEGRNAYADKSLAPKHDWQKFEYQYRLYGRLTYNPETDADGWRRYLRREFQGAAPAVEAALASASRILPVILTAHGVSGSNNSYWPEMYMNMPIVDASRAQPYGDTPDPKVFGTVSSFDPQLFATVEECAEALASGKTLAKYTALDVAQWLEDLSTAATDNQAQVTARATNKHAPEVRRLVADVAIQAGIGRFFAYKFRSAVLWSLYKRTGDRTALTEAVKAYRTGRDAWATMAAHAKTVYVSDITYGLNANLRGHWSDRLAGIDADLADMERHLKEPMPATTTVGDPAVARVAIRTVLTRPERPSFAAPHTPVQGFEPGKALEIAWSLAHSQGRNVSLQYRQADQSQTWRTVQMTWREGAYRGAIPAGYTQSRYPLLYYFEVHEAGGGGIYPGVGKDLSNQPYYLVRSSRAKVTNN